MSLVVCTYTGWVQIRLATNPDPTDEPRGVSGYTFALPGEPDLDRLLRSSDPVGVRSHGPTIGLVVRAVTVDDRAAPTHPLRGAQVRLLSQPRFESVNEVVMDQGYEALEPFDLEVTHGDFRLRRRDFLDLKRPDATVYDVPPALLQARRLASVTLTNDVLIAAHGVADPAGFRAARLALLRDDLAQADDPIARAALGRRISELENTDPSDRRTVSMTFAETRSYALDGPTELTDPHGWLSGLDTSATFACGLVMGAWDVDALSAYAAGTIALPLG